MQLLQPILASAEATDAGSSKGFFTGLAESFEKTFIYQDRWKFFLDGLLATLRIAFFAASFVIISH